eukprot:NODE_8106_length_298_cov_51.775100_g7367_i0.p3 GENE.NODE_8106_length_298_cov_51.775100_g7367_i0~~NODE_8106_length_298_cov_51.775100_g7367_i0.p3  ORF type:complete len:51 (-),score=2.98 NODE_8106_length_298_cov_51.775100_g7367_i0:8-160(-)
MFVMDSVCFLPMFTRHCCIPNGASKVVEVRQLHQKVSTLHELLVVARPTN